MIGNRQRNFDFAKYKWPLLALWVSVGLHGALIALVKIVPPRETLTTHTIEARLVSASQRREVPLYLPDLKSPAIEEVLAYAPPPASPNLAEQRSTIPPPPASLIPQIEIPLAVDLHYYSARELDVIPSGDMPDPVLPESLSGKARYRVKIEEDGRVSDVEVISVEMVPDTDTAVLAATEAALRATRFKPGIKQGRPVRALVIYELIINPAEPQRRFTD